MSLLSHSWKSSVRSIMWGRELASNIFYGAVLALLALNLLGIGLFIRPLLHEMYPGEDPVTLVNGIILIWWFLDMTLRIFMQTTPSVEVLSYLLLPVPKRRIVRFILLRMLMSGFNIVPLFALVPIVVTLFVPERGVLPAIAWFMGVMGLVLLSNVIIFLLDKLQSKRTRTVPIAVVFLITIFLLRYLGMVDVDAISSGLFGLFLSSPWTALLWLAGVAAVVEGAVSILTGMLHMDMLRESRRTGGGKAGGSVFSALERKGPIGTFLSLELKLLLRNARTRATFGLIVFVIFFVPLYYVLVAPTFLVFYPRPDNLPTSEILTAATLPEERLVTFVVHSNDIPDDAWVYLTGDHSLLGPWRPGRVPMAKVGDSTWRRTLPLVQGTTLRFIFTLGNWKTEAFAGPDLEPDVRQITITGDTTYIQQSPAWKEPGLDGFETFMLLYMAFLLVGMPMLAHGQFLFVWESNYFDLLLTSPIRTADYLRAKFYALCILGLVGLLSSLPTYFISDQLLPIHLAAGTYTLGVNSFLLMLWSTLSKKRMDLSASIFSMQGKGSTNFMAILPTTIAPIILFIVANLLLGPTGGLYLLTGLGIGGILLTVPLLRFIERTFSTRKYIMRAGFRAS